MELKQEREQKLEQKLEQKHPSSILPCALRKGGGRAEHSRGQAGSRAQQGSAQGRRRSRRSRRSSSVCALWERRESRSSGRAKSPGLIYRRQLRDSSHTHDLCIRVADVLLPLRSKGRIEEGCSSRVCEAPVAGVFGLKRGWSGSQDHPSELGPTRTSEQANVQGLPAGTDAVVSTGEFSRPGRRGHDRTPLPPAGEG